MWIKDNILLYFGKKKGFDEKGKVYRSINLHMHLNQELVRGSEHESCPRATTVLA